MLLSRENDVLPAGELGLSFAEVLRYLNDCGIPGEFIGGADCSLRAGAALAVFEAFETLIESNGFALAGVFVNLSGRENAVVKITFENLTESLPDGMKTKLTKERVNFDEQREDGVAYVCFSAEGGAV